MNRILIAEDEAAIAGLVRTVLTDAGYRCVWAPDGNQAADLLEQESFDLALLDIMLPGADGYELLDYCKALEVPVIFLTARGEVEDRVRGLRRGAEDYLTKPFALPELLARVSDPFTTTRTTRAMGLGLPLLRLAAEQTGGSLSIESTLGVGTTVTAVFHASHIDCPPVGDMAGTITLLIQGAPELELHYTHRGGRPGPPGHGGAARPARAGALPGRAGACPLDPGLPTRTGSAVTRTEGDVKP